MIVNGPVCEPPCPVEIKIDSCAITENGMSLESMICTEKLEVPATVGVPEITPALKLKPAGSEPLATLHFSGAVPPAAVNVVVYGVPTVPTGGVPVIVGSGLTVMLTVLEFFVPVTPAVKVNCNCEVIFEGAV
jgi:hypothetical protein